MEFNIVTETGSFKTTDKEQAEEKYNKLVNKDVDCAMYIDGKIEKFHNSNDGGGLMAS